ncbi:MAG: DUF1801 domain-containing protein [Bacteroidetes bacterium]|nr:DUF1801 domain-containing protein [Bacteroidota bacterium]
MNTEEQINAYIDSQPEIKRNDLTELHQFIQRESPDCKLWFLDGLNPEGKVVSNPNIGYGSRMIHYANGDSKEFYQVGISANTTGISVYIMGIEDKHYLKETFEKNIGKASVTGYCIKFKKLQDVNSDVLKKAIKMGIEKN